MKVLITQSNYIPWKGYFDSIAITDKFVVFDDMQYTKRDWRNRNRIKSNNGLKWLSIPVEVKGKYYQKIKDTQIADINWNTKHLSIIKQFYKNAEYYKDVIVWLESVYNMCSFKYLSEINVYFIKEICDFLGIEVDIVFSSDFELTEDKTKRLVDICEKLNGTEYYTGPSAKEYLDESRFKAHNIKVSYFDYSGYKNYNQLYPPFEHKVSIIDLIFNVGPNARNYLKY